MVILNRDKIEFYLKYFSEWFYNYSENPDTGENNSGE